MTLVLTAKQKEALELLKGPQRHTLLAGGARSGKTWLLSLVLVIRALKAPNSRHVIFRFRSNAIWASIGLDTLPSVLRALNVPYEVRVQDRYFVLPNGSEIWLAGLDSAERAEKILGMQFVSVFFNEASQIPYSSFLLAKTRLAQVCPEIPQRLYVDLNPAGTNHYTFRLFIEKKDPDSRQPLPSPEDYAAMYINPVDNRENLSDEFIKSLETLPERQRRRFFDGTFQSEIDGALWTYELLDKCHVERSDIPNMRRIVVAVDPSGASGAEDERSDEVGIIVAGKGVDGKAYILADRTCKLSPAGWGRVAVDAYREFKADRIIAERNFGGAMVEHVIKTTDPGAPFKDIVSSRGKVLRAEPVSSLYEKGEVFHAGRFNDLEDQMSNFSSAGYLGERSPDRVDAMVFAITELMMTGTQMKVSPLRI